MGMKIVFKSGQFCYCKAISARSYIVAFSQIHHQISNEFFITRSKIENLE